MPDNEHTYVDTYYVTPMNIQKENYLEEFTMLQFEQRFENWTAPTIRAGSENIHYGDDSTLLIEINSAESISRELVKA